jgi:hypothetical protein
MQTHPRKACAANSYCAERESGSIMQHASLRLHTLDTLFSYIRSESTVIISKPYPFINQKQHAVHMRAAQAGRRHPAAFPFGVNRI